MGNSNLKNSFLNSLSLSPQGAELPLPWSPTLDAEREAFLAILKQYAVQIPQDNGLKAWIAYRDMIGKIFPGQMDAAAALAILTVVAANAVSSVCEQMEGDVVADDPAIRGRREAIASLFAEVLNAAAQQRTAHRLQAIARAAN
jgi:predicted negative regulator of RcsB-dependent stress response